MLTTIPTDDSQIIIALAKATNKYTDVQAYVSGLPGLSYQVNFGAEYHSPDREEMVSLREMIESLNLSLSDSVGQAIGHVMDVITVNQTLAPIKTRSYQRGYETITENIYPLALYPVFLNALLTSGIDYGSERGVQN